MKISLFSVQDHYPDRPRTVPQLYQEVMDQAVLAESLGYEAFFPPSTIFIPTASFPILPRFSARLRSTRSASSLAPRSRF